MTKRVLITGVAGQDGRYLTTLLLSRGCQVFGVVGPNPGEFGSWAAEYAERLVMVQADMRDAASLDHVVGEIEPHSVFNFGGLTSVGASWSNPELYADINGQGVVRLLDAIKRFAPSAHLVQASSAEIFGEPKIAPQNESFPLQPTNPYGRSKAVAHIAVQEARLQGMHASNAILYNHESPLRPVTFVTTKVADGAARISTGLASELRLGNLDVVRDWGYAGDYVKAMALIADAAKPDDFIVSTGEGHTVRDLAEMAFRHVGLDYRDHVVVDPALYREAEAARLVGDSTHIRSTLGWKPTVDFEALVAMLVDAALAKLG